MSMQPLPPNPCLVAVLLVAKTTSDPFIVFHYPPKPGEDNTRFKSLFPDVGESTTTSSSDEGSPDSASEQPKSNQQAQEDHGRASPPHDIGSTSPEKSAPLTQSQHLSDLLGFQSPVLAKVLSPPATSNKKRFEVTLNGRVFLGRPVFAKPDGAWKKAKKPRRSSSRSNLTSEKSKKNRDEMKAIKGKSSGIEEKDYGASGYETSAGDQSDLQAEICSNEHIQETKGTSDTGSGKAQKIGTIKNSPKVTKKPLVMFNLVCIVQPPPLEYHVRVREMYDHVVRKLSKALKWEQAHSNWVANEVASIVSLKKYANKQSLNALYQDLVTQSTLARAMANLFNSISNCRIAHLSLTPSLSLSLQIPIPTSISLLPNAVSPQLPGLWLTTANSMPVDDEAQTSGPQLGSHFTLLLLSDLHTIMADVRAASSPITEPLTLFLRVSTPTKSFYQISQSSHIPLQDIQFLASHLIYWRRARAIPPLHQRDTYIVSPNADMRNLGSAAPAFAKAFPALPSLPHLLSSLSSRPRPYSNLIPSKDHKETYMEILAWLMRGGWVTQLRTFAWVRVPAQIKDSVSRQRAMPKADASSQHTTPDGTDKESHDNFSSPVHLDIPSAAARSASPTSSIQTILPVTNASSTQHSSSLIANPRLASHLPSRHLSAISQHVLAEQGEESQAAWDKCIKYFDGRHAIETIPVREGWKRKKVKELMDGWVELGILVRGRHW